MTIKQIIEGFNSQLKSKEITNGGRMSKALGILAVKAETVGGEEGKELAGLCDKLRPYFKKLPNVTSEEVLSMASDFAKLMHFSEKEENYYLFMDDEETHGQAEEEKLDEQKEFYSECCRDAYRKYLAQRDEYINRFGELPDMEDLL